MLDPSPAARPLRRAGLLVSCVLGALFVGGLAARLTPDSALYRFDLDTEWGFAALVSAALLLGAAATLTAGLLRSGFGLLSLALPGLLAFMAFDELFQVHEMLEIAVDVDWQVLYLPMFLACGLAWGYVLRRLPRPSSPGTYLVLGAVSWVVAQVLEKLEWDARDEAVSGYVLLMFCEEMLEAAGAGAFLLAGLGLYLRASAGTAAARACAG